MCVCVCVCVFTLPCHWFEYQSPYALVGTSWLVGGVEATVGVTGGKCIGECVCVCVCVWERKMQTHCCTECILNHITLTLNSGRWKCCIFTTVYTFPVCSSRKRQMKYVSVSSFFFCLCTSSTFTPKSIGHIWLSINYGYLWVFTKQTRSKMFLLSLVLINLQFLSFLSMYFWSAIFLINKCHLRPITNYILCLITFCGWDNSAQQHLSICCT